MGVEVIRKSTDIPDSTNISNSYPNPFCPKTDFEIKVKEKAASKMSFYDEDGKIIAVLFEQELEPGEYEIRWVSTNLKSGIYFYEFISGESKDIKKLILVK